MAKKPSRAIKLFGTEASDGKRRELAAGPITAMFDNGALRYIRYRGVEVLRGIAYLLRDKNWGVHNIDFTAQVLDAATGAVLVPATAIRAELPALAGAQMKAARAKGQTQKSMITAHVARTVQGWLALGPDNRGEFSRQGN